MRETPRLRSGLSALHKSVRSNGAWWAYGLALAIVLVMYGAQAFLAWTAIAEYTNGHHLFPEPWGGYAMAAVVELGVVVSFLLFTRRPWFAGAMLVVFASTSYVLQKLHAEHVNHPLFISAIVPAALVLGGIALHLIKPPRAEVPPAGPVEETRVEERGHVPVDASGLTGRALVEHIIRTEGDRPTAELVERAQVTDRTVRTARANVRANGSRP